MCGIVGIVGRSNVNLALYDALTLLQHRGQDAAGIMTCEDDGRIAQKKALGLVSEVFRTRHMRQLRGRVGIGHVRYPTAGTTGPELAQPFYVNSPFGIGLAHNGNLTNARQLSEEGFRADLRHVNTSSDSEVLLNVLAHELQARGRLHPAPADVFAAVERLHERVRGGYAFVALIAGYGLLAVRDPNGLRPLVIGRKETEDGPEFVVASESVALDILGFKLVRDVAPGEAVYVTKEGELFEQVCAPDAQLRPCIFEHVYFARPDSILDGVSVYKTRIRQGERLAAKIQRERPDHDIDVVIPIPDSSRVAGDSLARALGVKCREGLVKNRYVGRTFIMPVQKQRKKSVRQKLNPIPLEFEGKNVLLVDDSIVRGTTCEQLIHMAREAGAKRVYFASASPPVRHPNVYGIDMPTRAELVASGLEVDEIARTIGADWLVYQDLDDLCQASRDGNERLDEFDCSVFDGEYVTGDVTEEYLAWLAQTRSDAAKEKERSEED